MSAGGYAGGGSSSSYRLFPYLLLVPAIVILIAIIYPWLLGLLQSFTDYSLLNPDNLKFIGARNYRELLFTAYAYRGGEVMHGRDGQQHPLQPVVNELRGQVSDAAIDLDRSELEGILEHARTAALSQAECDKLHAAMETLIYLTQELEKNRVSVQRLKQLLFGTTTEKTQKVMEKILDEAEKKKHASDDAEEGEEAQKRKKAKGHGRNGANTYTGADKVRVPHESLKGGDACPNCQKGTVYESVEPGRLVRIRGQAPLGRGQVRTARHEVRRQLAGHRGRGVGQEGRRLDPAPRVLAEQDLQLTDHRVELLLAGGQTYEAIPAELIVRAGLLAAESSLAKQSVTKPCCPRPCSKPC